MPSSSAALSGTHWSVLEALDNRKLGTVAEYAVPATRYQQLSRFAPLLSCKSTLWATLVSAVKA